MKRTFSRSRWSRRAVLKGLGAAGLGSWAAPLVLPAGICSAGEAAPHNKLHVAAVGTGGRCSALLQEVLRDGHHVVALCNVDRDQLDRAAQMVAEQTGASQSAAKQPKLYEDYRQLLEAERSLDAVLVATGSRWHAPLCVVFMKAGKHVFCEKPLVRKLAEARELIELAPQCRVATQHGTQGGSSQAFRRSIEIIQAGLLGQVRQVYLWCDGYGRFPASHDRPPGEDPVPPGLNWDFWLAANCRSSAACLSATRASYLPAAGARTA